MRKRGGEREGGGEGEGEREEGEGRERREGRKTEIESTQSSQSRLYNSNNKRETLERLALL